MASVFTKAVVIVTMMLQTLLVASDKHKFSKKVSCGPPPRPLLFPPDPYYSSLDPGVNKSITKALTVYIRIVLEYAHVLTSTHEANFYFFSCAHPTIPV